MKNHIIVCSIIAVLAGCATSPADQIRMVESITACCERISQIPTTHQIDGELSFEISSSNPVFIFETGKSHIALIELPKNSTATTVDLLSYPGSPTHTEHGGAHMYFDPIITQLNGHKEALAQEPAKRLLGIVGWSGQGAIVMSTKILPETKFLLLHTNREKIGKLESASVKSGNTTIMIGSNIISVSGSNAIRAVYSTTGKLKLSLK